MRHAAGTKRKKQQHRHDWEPYSDRGEQLTQSSTYHYARQRGFLSGEDVRLSLDADMEPDDSPDPTSH